MRFHGLHFYSLLLASSSSSYNNRGRTDGTSHLIAIFSRTALAKEFRRWVVDVLDKEVGTGQRITLSDDELHSLAWLWRAADNMMDAAKSIYPLLRVAEHKEAARYYSIIHEYAFTLQQAKNILADKTRLVQPSSLGTRDWDRLIPHLI